MRVVVVEIRRAVDVQVAAGNTLAHQRSDVGPTAVRGELPRADRLEKTHDVGHQGPKSLVRRGERETFRLEGARVRFDREQMVRELGAVRCEVLHTAAQSVLLVRVEHDPDCPFRAQAELLQQPDGFPDLNAPAGVIVRSRSRVPRIVVRGEQDDLVGILRALQLGNDVRRFHIGQHLRIHDEPQPEALAPGLHASESLGALDRYCGRRYLRDSFVVSERACVRCVETDRAYRPYEHCDGSVLRRPRGSGSAILHGCAVIRVRHVVADDLAAHRFT